MEATACIDGEIYQLTPLETVQIAAWRYGFNNLDLKDNDTGGYTLVAYRNLPTGSVSVTARGKTLPKTVERMLEIFKE